MVTNLLQRQVTIRNNLGKRSRQQMGRPVFSVHRLAIGPILPRQQNEAPGIQQANKAVSAFERAGGRCENRTQRDSQTADQWSTIMTVRLSLTALMIWIIAGRCLSVGLSPGYYWRTGLPVEAKSTRVRNKHIGIKRQRSSFQTNRDGVWKRKMNGEIIRR